MLMRKNAALSVVFSLLACSPTYAATGGPVLTGGALIQVQDGTPHPCIDVSQNLVSMTLVDTQIQRSQSWWDKLLHKKQALGVKFDVVITDTGAHTFDFPRAQQLGTTGQTSDIALLPMQYPIMSKYPLYDSAADAAKNITYNNVELDLYFIEVDGASPAFDSLMTLVNFSKNLPLPPNPYTVGIGYFGTFANDIEQTDLKTGPNANPDATFGFNLASDALQASTANCNRTKLHSGVQAVVFDYSGATADPNIIQAAQVGNYCFWFDSSSNRIVYALKGGTDCGISAPAGAHQLDNSLVAFLVNADPVVGATQAAPGAAISKLQPTAAAVTASVSDVAMFTSTRFGPGSAAAANVDPSVVAGLLKQFSVGTALDPAAVSALASQATPEDVSVTVALKRCAVVGIKPADCN